jgi:predicted dehydrogenase
MVIKTAIIGFGSLGRGSWFKEVNNHPDFKMVGVVDTDTELLENLHTVGLSEDDGFVSIDDMVALGTKPDLAIIATPIYTHHVLVKECMDLGIHVICEKNMASTIYQGRQMVQCAVDHPELTTAVGTQYRYFPKNWNAHVFFTTEDNNIGPISFMRWESAGNWGEKRRGWRRWLAEIYLEDMCTHYFDLMRYITGMDIVQVKADTFIPKYSKWQGSSTVFCNVALAKPEDYKHRRNWTWCQLYGDWQARGPGFTSFKFYCEKGQAKINEHGFGLETLIYKDEEGYKYEEDGYITDKSIENLGTTRQGQGIILDMVKKSIESKGKYQPGTNFIEGFKSFCGSMAAIESSRTGQAVWVPKYWEDLPVYNNNNNN